MLHRLAALVCLLVCSAVVALASPNTSVPPGRIDGIFSRSYAEGGAGAGAGDCTCIDLVLVIDDTGSMGLAIANVAAGMEDILTLAGSTCSSVQAGLITFKDDVEVDVPLTFATGDVATAVAGLIADGGADEPEASDEALREAFTATVCPLTGDFDPGAFRAECCKVAILVTDAHPGGCDDLFQVGVDNVNAHQRALDAQALGIRIGALFVPTFGAPADILAIMTDYAATTGGVFGQAAGDGTGTAAAIQQVILDCIGAGATELCCLPDGTCVEVLEGQCSGLGGTVVATCDDCHATPVSSKSWGAIKSTYNDE